MIIKEGAETRNNVHEQQDPPYSPHGEKEMMTTTQTVMMTTPIPLRPDIRRTMMDENGN